MLDRWSQLPAFCLAAGAFQNLSKHFNRGGAYQRVSEMVTQLADDFTATGRAGPFSGRNW
jgi:hypothetical protein